MNIYKNLLFLHGDLREARFADPPRSYADGYGNAVASRLAFPRVRGRPDRQDRRATALAPVLAACGCR